jgi:hypothetical protein
VIVREWRTENKRRTGCDEVIALSKLVYQTIIIPHRVLSDTLDKEYRPYYLMVIGIMGYCRRVSYSLSLLGNWDRIIGNGIGFMQT